MKFYSARLKGAQLRGINLFFDLFRGLEKEVFKKQTKTKKQLFWAFVSAHGLRKTLYSQEMISAVSTLDDLFRKIE
jgi:hypothetical protein